MGRKLIAIEAPEQYLAITWQVNNFCNFRCSYCNPGNWAGENPNNGNLDIYINNLKFNSNGEIMDLAGATHLSNVFLLISVLYLCKPE